jgi:multimeric flavodoxin WrbA
MERTGWESEFVKLTDLTFTGCKGCADLCAKPQVCKVEDDLYPYYHSLKDADAIVLGASVYFDSINATMRAFVERFYGYRHVSIAISGKPVILALAGGGPTGKAMEEFRQLMEPFNLNVVDTINYCSRVPPCFICGRHTDCSIGGLYQMMGEAAHTVEVAPEMFNRWEDEHEVIEAIGRSVAELKGLYEDEDSAAPEAPAADSVSSQ